MEEEYGLLSYVMWWLGRGRMLLLPFVTSDVDAQQYVFFPLAVEGAELLCCLVLKGQQLDT